MNITTDDIPLLKELYMKVIIINKYSFHLISSNLIINKNKLVDKDQNILMTTSPRLQNKLIKKVRTT